MSGSIKRTLRSGEVAEEFGLAAATVQGYAREGRIPASQTPGGQYRFDLDEVRRTLFPDAGFTQLHHSRLTDPLSGESFLIRGSAVATEAEQSGEESLTGFIRETRVAVRADETLPRAAVAELPSFDERRGAAKRAARVFSDVSVAAFAVLR